MTRVFFSEELEASATFWRIRRNDGVTLGLTSHDRDLWFDGVLHRASPGMLPSSIRRTGDLAPDSAEAHGALSHDSITAADLALGRFDRADVEVGVVDWETGERAVLYTGRIGDVSQEAAGFEAELTSAKAGLQEDHVPRTSPTCRAQFCGPGCTLSSARFTHQAIVAAVDAQSGQVRFDGSPSAELMPGGWVRWLEGPQTGLRADVAASEGEWLMLSTALPEGLAPGMRAELREGCNHTFATCQSRFGNGLNFQGEPFLPGNDFLAQYPRGSAA